MKNYFYILFLLSFAINDPSHIDLDQYDIDNLYLESIELRKNGMLNESLKTLFQIKCCHLEANYKIAEIYLNEFNNFNIALDYFNIIIRDIDVSNPNIDEGKRNLYKKALFMTSYIYSNYLGLYSKGYQGYQLFFKTFPNDDLIESVNYEMGLLEPKEKEKKKILSAEK